MDVTAFVLTIICEGSKFRYKGYHADRFSVPKALGWLDMCVDVFNQQFL